MRCPEFRERGVRPPNRRNDDCLRAAVVAIHDPGILYKGIRNALLPFVAWRLTPSGLPEEDMDMDEWEAGEHGKLLGERGLACAGGAKNHGPSHAPSDLWRHVVARCSIARWMPIVVTAVFVAWTSSTARSPDGYLLGSYRIATAPEPNSFRLTSFKSIPFDSPANNVGRHPHNVISLEAE